MLGCAVKLLDLWQILDHPPEQPDFYVAVRQWITHDGAAFRGNVESFGFRTLDGARVFLQAKGLTRIDRHPDDDPAVVETWI